MSVYLVRRETKRGPRWHVRCELPGTPIIHLGVYETKTLADLRRSTALEEIAKGRIPVRFTPTPQFVPNHSIEFASAQWLATLHDLAPSTIAYYKRTAETLPDWLARMDSHAVSYTDIQRHVAEMKKAPGTIRKELAVLRMILDNAGVVANPVGDRRVRLPRKGPKRMRLPSKADIALLHAALPTRVDLLTLLEHTGMRISEAAALRWENIDYERDRLLVNAGKTSAARRWINHLPGTPPFPKKPEEGSEQRSLVFKDPAALSLTSVLRESHIDSNGRVPHYSSHDFRHLHASRLLHNNILSPAQIAERLGHATPAITLSVYSHVVPPD